MSHMLITVSYRRRPLGLVTLKCYEFIPYLSVNTRVSVTKTDRLTLFVATLTRTT
jgi:hypothetical protein